MAANAFKYVWNRKDPTSQPGIAISGQNNRLPKTFISSRAEAETLIAQLKILKNDPTTWRQHV